MRGRRQKRIGGNGGVKDSDRGKHDSDKPTRAEMHAATYANFIGKKKEKQRERKRKEEKKNTLSQTHSHANHVSADRVTHTIFLRTQLESGAENATRDERNKN